MRARDSLKSGECESTGNLQKGATADGSLTPLALLHLLPVLRLGRGQAKALLQ